MTHTCSARGRSHALRAHLLTTLACVWCAASSARALEGDEGTLGVPHPIGGNTAHTSASAGMFLRFAESPSTTGHALLVESHAGYDGARSGAAAETRGEAVLYTNLKRSDGPRVGLALLGGGNHAGAAGRRESSSAGYGGIKVQPIFQALHGLDGAVAVSYVSRGFNLRPAVATDLLVSRRVGTTQLLLNLVYGQGLEDGERYGSVRAAALTRVVDELRLGLDLQISADLELDEDEPENEPELQILAGPALSYTAWHLSFTLQGGISAMRYRDSEATLLGAATSFGIGATL